MTTMSRQVLKSESVTMIRIGVHLAGEEHDNTSYVRPLGSHIRQPSVKSLLGWNQAPAPRMKSWFPAIVGYGCHPGLIHSPTIKVLWSREVRFDNSKLAHWDQNGMVLYRHRRGLPPWNLRITTTRYPPFPSECSSFPYLPHPVIQTTWI
jgi:hypothetical protein